MKIFIFRHGLLTAGLAKTTAHRVLFLVSMDSQRSKKFDGSHFWALGCLQTASGWLESIRAIMAPPPSNVIPEPAQNRVKTTNKILIIPTHFLSESKTKGLGHLHSLAIHLKFIPPLGQSSGTTHSVRKDIDF